MITGASNICDRCNQHAFAILNRLSGKYECELCAPGLHAWSRHGVSPTVHVNVDVERFMIERENDLAKIGNQGLRR